MFQYYFMLGVRSLRRNPALTALMVLTLAIGVAASVSTLTILHVMSGNPIPHKSDRLFVPLLDNGPLQGYNPGDPKPRTRNDADELPRRDEPAQGWPAANAAPRCTASSAPIEPARKDLPVSANGLAPTRDFFAMFDVPFLYGQPWGEAEDGRRRRGRTEPAMSEKLFGDINPVGKRIRRMANFDLPGGRRARALAAGAASSTA
jgi:putative ABC transport system permease protein